MINDYLCLLLLEGIMDGWRQTVLVGPKDLFKASTISYILKSKLTSSELTFPRILVTAKHCDQRDNSFWLFSVKIK